MSRFTRRQLVRDVALAETILATKKDTATWPEGVFARYQTVVEASVDLRWHNADEGYAFADCTGCGKHFSWEHDRFTREKAQAHAESCRAVPRPETVR